MAAPTFTITALVVGHTKLGESDLILTLLAEDGSQYRAVAKGARKPSSVFASRLELYSVATLLLAKGKTLDIVKEARLLNAHENLRIDFVRSACAAPIAELLSKATLQDQPTLRLFDLAESALTSLEASHTKPEIICLATLLKALAFLGFKPIFNNCISCGLEINFSQPLQAFSYFDGGCLCAGCRSFHETTQLDSFMLKWANTLLYSKFSDMDQFNIPTQTLVQAYSFTSEWVHVHLGLNLKSLTFLRKNILL
jgi:DNA repair protein RecO (recombination protein O)